MPSTFPFTRRQALAGALLLALLLVLAGRFLLQPGDDAGGRAAAAIVAEPEPAQSTEPARPAEIVVHVVGAVAQPGLYRLEEGSRVADAVALAGGATRKASLAAVNLAAPLVDGTQVVVPKAGEAAAAASPGPTGSAQAAAGPIRLSTATAEQLETIPGVGPVTAQRIIEYRERNGPFRSVEDLDAVPGIGPKRLEQLRELVAP